MRATKAVAFTMAAMLLLAGTVAVGAAAPAEQANSTAGNASEDAQADDPGANASDNAQADDRPDEAGPSGGLPDAVPDHVEGIHERIGSFLDGSIDDLGSSLSDYLGGGEQAENGQSDAGNGDADA